MEWPIFFKDQLIIGNLSSNIGLCTLWFRKDLVEGKVDKDRYAVIGNLYTADGISYIIRNVLANPKIRAIVLFGPDLMHAGEAFELFMRNGVDNEYKIKGANAYIHKDIPKDLLEKFRNNVKLFRYDGNLEALNSFLDGLNDKVEKGAFIEPVILDKINSKKLDLVSEDVGYRVEGKDFIETWLKALDVVDKFGEIKESDYRLKQKEVFTLVSVIDTNEVNIPSWLPTSKNDFEIYQKEFFNKDKPKGVDYTYGERLFSYFVGNRLNKSIEEMNLTLDQVKIAEEHLKKHRYSRRAIAVTWSHDMDFNSSNPPCLIQVSWLIKFNRLFEFATFRSHDIFGAWLLNVYALIKLQEKVAKDLNVGLGKLIVTSVSAHIYENNWELAKELLDKYYRNKEEPFVEDPRGYFLISIDKDKKEIIVKHKLNDGRDSGIEFRGNNAAHIYRSIIHENLISKLDHAAYLGKELERAGVALKEGKDYVQDSG